MISSAICLAAAVFFEARDQPLEGQYAVAEVVMNRVSSDRWPDDICGVVYQDKQFSFTHDGKSDDYNKYSTNVGDRQARLNLTSTHYHATYVSPYWTNHYHLDGRIGDHIFYTAPEGK
jgi:spore germination cell wall hydrolase CwlJ-like protein